jgi:3-oxoacyl-[acyl-carrier protein] reductase
MDLGLKNKVAIVLAASKGLGRASAAALAAEGAQVVIGARDGQLLAETARQLQQETGSRVLAVPTDVTRPADLEAIVEAARREFNGVDILVNNAGGPPPGRFDAFDDAQWQSAFELNLLSA